MKEYEILDEHTADVMVLAYGKNLEGVFKNAAKALFNTITASSIIERKNIKEISIEADNLKSLLVNWLEELIFYFDVEGWIFEDFEIKIEKKNDMWFLTAKCYGEHFNPNKHKSGVEVKGISYHMLEFGKKNGLHFAKVIFDI
ncbi:MAG: archease [Candidatus Njordarchaeales archaeon]